jgi:outer membrane protein
MINQPRYNPVHFKIIILFVCISSSFWVRAQSLSDSLPVNARLSDCIRYALNNQPGLKQSFMEEEIAKQTVRFNTSQWLPQVGVNANIQHYFQAPVSLASDPSSLYGTPKVVGTSLSNASGVQLSASQVIFNSDVLFAERTASYYRRNVSQNTQNVKIDLIITVSKAFYDIMFTQQQLNLINDDIERLARNLKDTYSQYSHGISDKIDFKRATIALNNASAEKKGTEETLQAKYAYLKQLMGSPFSQKLNISYDSATMSNEINIDTLQVMGYQNRIEYQILQTQLTLQKYLVSYYKMNYLPSLSAFANYSAVYQGNQFSNLYLKNFPNSSAGISLSFPLFDGTRRIHSLKKAEWQFQQMVLDTVILKNSFNTEYSQALAGYKSNLMELHVMEENVAIAHEVYNLVKFQYEKGIKTYLEVIVSETDLRSAELNHMNALFHVISAKLDVERALGSVPLNY